MCGTDANTGAIDDAASGVAFSVALTVAVHGDANTDWRYSLC
jgi:hypothetical protein